MRPETQVRVSVTFQDDESIRNAIIRYEIRHPCVNDGEMSLWRDLGISSWPTLAVVSPRGGLIATLPGVPHSLGNVQETAARLFNTQAKTIQMGSS